MRASTERKHSINCSECEALIDERNCYYTKDGNALCDSCFASGYELCSECSFIFPLTEMVIAENEVDIYCPYCSEELPDNISICSTCDEKTDDDKGETKWDEHGDPYCRACYTRRVR